jgi:hypothetical protein
VNQLLRVQNFNVSRDGFGAGEHPLVSPGKRPMTLVRRLVSPKVRSINRPS